MGANHLAFFLLFSFKYILCTVTDPEKPSDSKEIIRGTAMAEFHGTLLLNAEIFLHMLGSLFNACQQERVIVISFILSVHLLVLVTPKQHQLSLNLVDRYFMGYT